MNWRWICPSVLYAIHDRQIAEHGGLDGMRDLGAIESALARPQTLAAYQTLDAAAIAAAYAFGIIRNHGFADGNKRTGWIAARLFLADNGFRLSFDKQDAVRIMEAVAASEMTEDLLADWLRRQISATSTD